MTDRTTLALAACEGLSNEELATRGSKSFAKMIERKRKYAGIARAADVAMKLADKKFKGMQATIKAQQSEIEQLKAKLAMLEQLDSTIEDTSAAMAMLATIKSKPANSQ